MQPSNGVEQSAGRYAGPWCHVVGSARVEDVYCSIRNCLYDSSSLKTLANAVSVDNMFMEEVIVITEGRCVAFPSALTGRHVDSRAIMSPTCSNGL